MRPLDNDGVELDATFSIERTDLGFDLVMESSGGAKRGERNGRNKDYAPALRLLLSRMAQQGFVLQNTQVISTRTVGMTPAQRSVPLDLYPYPISLASLPETEPLRLALGRASAAFLRAPEQKTSGNSRKRLRLSITGPSLANTDLQAIGRLLARRFDEQPEAAKLRTVEEPEHKFVSVHSIWTEEPTANPDALEESVRALGKKLGSGASPLEPPPGSRGGQQVTSQSTRYVRDPNIIAWVLNEAAGKCEICDEPAPFVRMDGTPFLEVHHIRPLGEGGPDTTDNAVAACPNCHRRLHYAKDRNGTRHSVISKLHRLVDHPPNPAFAAQHPTVTLP